jgi:hypothetical protein
MNYRIEDGEAKIPISELNRLNDEWDMIKDDRAKFEADRAKYEKGLVMVTEYCRDYSGYNSVSRSTVFISKDEAVDIISKQKSDQLEYIEKLEKDKYHLKQMSILEFIKWRRS